MQVVLDELVEDFDPNAVRLSEHSVISRYRETNANLRTQICRIIREAGLIPWPKLLQNLRTSRATELAVEFPAHVAAEWMGHSTVVADKHYWRVPKSQAVTIESRFEYAIRAKENGVARDPETSRWATSISDELRSKLSGPCYGRMDGAQ